MRVVILCGGLGTRLREETEFKPKPMVEVGGHPILWHIMRGYAQRGYNDFVLLLGYKGEYIKRYFLDYRMLNSDLSLKLGKPEVTFHARESDLDWTVTLVDTGSTAMTGARIARAVRYLDGDRFMVTYGDGVTDLDMSAVEKFHLAHGKLATVTGVRPPARFGDLTTEGDKVLRFAEKPHESGGYISGGFFVFERKVLDYLSADEGCALEQKPLEKLAQDDELRMFAHDGFWHPMDTLRDMTHLNTLWSSGQAPWKTWRGQ